MWQNYDSNDEKYVHTVNTHYKFIIMMMMMMMMMLMMTVL